MRVLITSLFCVFSFWLTAQVTVTPSTFAMDDTVTITYDATKGDSGLKNFNGPVYVHTGLITEESNDLRDWQYVVANWGMADSTVLMDSVAPNQYEKTVHLREFYDVPASEVVLQLAFVFRNADGSQSGRAADGSDLYVPLVSGGLEAYDGYELEGQKLSLYYGENSVGVEAYQPGMVSVTFNDDTTSAPDTSRLTVAGAQPVNVTFEDRDSLLFYATDSLQLFIQKDTLEIRFLRLADSFQKTQTGYASNFGFNKLVGFTHTASETIHGTGARAIPLNRNGEKLTFYNQQNYGYGNGARQMNICIPLLVSNQGYGLFFDNHHKATADIGANNSEELTFTANGGTMRYFFMTGDYDQVLDKYTWLTGRQPLPPRWALGYIQSKYGYQNETEARNIVSKMRNAGFSMDALILDLYWFEQMGDLDWHDPDWPNYQDMIADFKSEGIKTILITEPYFTLASNNYNYLANNHLLAETPAGDPYVLNGFWAGDAALLDIFQQDAQDWMWGFYKDRNNEGVAGWWCDLGEPETHPGDMQHSIGEAEDVHNIYALEWEKMLYEKHRQDFPERRLFNLNRSGYAGMQRYSTFPWSGDVQRSWDGFRAQIPIIAGMGMSGIGYMHCDVGGFTGGGKQPELYTRWMQMGAFLPVFRAHGTGVDTEPVNYSQPYQDICQKYIDLRYRMLPYNYSIAWQNTMTGKPLVKPMDYFHPWDDFFSQIPSQFYWGDNLVVAPILEEGVKSRQVILPVGRWVNYHNNQAFDGHQNITVQSHLQRIPLFVRSGSFLPMTTAMASTEDYRGDTLIIHHYADSAAGVKPFTIYEDDGKNPDALAAGENLKMHLGGENYRDSLKLTIAASGNGYPGMVSERQLIFAAHFVNQQLPGTVHVNGQYVDVYADTGLFVQDTLAAFINYDDQTIYVKFPWRYDAAEVVFSGGIAGLEPLDEKLDLQVFPNPATDQVVVNGRFPENANIDIHLLDLAGRQIGHLWHTNGWNQEQIAVTLPPRLAAGMYLLRIRINGISVTKRLMVR